MTLGDRVAVMRSGVIQQVDTPKVLYNEPGNLFVAGFIGSPAMNLLEASLARADGALVVQLGDLQLPVPPEVLAERPALAGYDGRKVVVGIRPEDMEDAALVADAPADRRIPATVELREALGSDVVIHFTIAAPPAVGDDVRELAVDVGKEVLEKVERTAERGEASVIARLNPRTHVQKGDRIELVVDTARLHFFDPDDGSGVYEAPDA
jgi:multiple sugar transport system ATP-binding protein